MDLRKLTEKMLCGKSHQKSGHVTGPPSETLVFSRYHITWSVLGLCRTLCNFFCRAACFLLWCLGPGPWQFDLGQEPGCGLGGFRLGPGTWEILSPASPMSQAPGSSPQPHKAKASNPRRPSSIWDLRPHAPKAKPQDQSVHNTNLYALWSFG